MVFSSAIFLFGFLPLVVALYFALPWLAAKNILLLVASLLFYAWGEPVYVWLMVLSIVANWLFALCIGGAQTRSARRRGKRGSLRRAPERALGDDDGFDSLDVSPAEKAYYGSEAGRARTPALATCFLVLALVFDLGALCTFKYLPFICEQVNRLAGSAVLPDIQLALPIGISFYTLQAISYVVDVWRGHVKAQANPLYLGTYIAMFPQLVAGPIVRYTDIEEALMARHTSFAGFARGVRLFIVGLGKKVLLANVCGILADSLLPLAPADIGFVGCASAICAYTFQIYFDFGGYSDMAIGLGSMFGFEYPRNFNYPYISTSTTEFWRRWHMTLGSFFRDYVYIPLGGNRVSTPRWMLNLLIVWGLTGIWHGAAWNFLLWGLYYGVILMLEKLFWLRVLEKLPRALRHLYAILVFFFGWMIFAVSGGLGTTARWFLALFGRYGWLGTSNLWELQSWSYVALIPILVLASTPIIPWLRKKLELWAQGASGVRVEAAPGRGNDFVPPCKLSATGAVSDARGRVVGLISLAADLGLLLVLVASLMSVASNSYNPFIYFQF